MVEKVLVAVIDFKDRSAWSAVDVAGEMQELVRACAGDPVTVVYCPADPPTPATLIHKGKVEEIAGLVREQGIQMVVFSEELKGHHQRNLEEAFLVKTLDRTTLILDIFARRAKSQEGQLQVELAQLEYRLPRLAGNYEQLSRQGGGIGTLGPGETRLESDRRRIEQRIDRLRKDLQDVTRVREVKRKRREGRYVPLVSLVGYTNAGKSTLLNALTGSDQLTRNGLFTTLDSVARQCLLPNRQKVVFSDTVGFMHALPHRLIEAFKATLEEVRSADLLLHVIDVSNPHYQKFKLSVDEVLGQLDCLDKPTVLVFNKIDLLHDPAGLEALRARSGNTVLVSASERINLEGLLEKVELQLADLIVKVDVVLPATRMDLVSLAYAQGDVILEEYLPEGIHLQAYVPRHLAGRLSSSGTSGSPEGGGRIKWIVR